MDGLISSTLGFGRRPRHWQACQDNAPAHTWISFSLLAWQAMQDSSTYMVQTCQKWRSCKGIVTKPISACCFLVTNGKLPIFQLYCSLHKHVFFFLLPDILFEEHNITTPNCHCNVTCSSSFKHKATMISIWAQMSNQPSTQEPQEGLIILAYMLSKMTQFSQHPLLNSAKIY